MYHRLKLNLINLNLVRLELARLPVLMIVSFRLIAKQLLVFDIVHLVIDKARPNRVQAGHESVVVRIRV